MKKIVSFLVLLALALSFTACSGEPPVSDGADAPQQGGEPVNQPGGEAGSEQESGGSALVVYFSWSGNTAAVAAELQSQTGADLFEIVPAEPYTDDYDTLLTVAQQEQRDGARPAIAGSVENMEQYDTVYVGFPNWWGDMPMILYSFFDSYDLSGKTVALFCTSGGSGLSGSVETVRELEPNAVVTEGLHVRSSSAQNAAEAVSSWLAQLSQGGQAA